MFKLYLWFVLMMPNPFDPENNFFMPFSNFETDPVFETMEACRSKGDEFMEEFVKKGGEYVGGGRWECREYVAD